MSRIQKRLNRLFQGSKDVKWSEIQTILSYYGCTLEKPNGSHWVVYNKKYSELGQITIPVHGNRIKPVYVKRLVQFLEELLEREGD